MHTKGMAMKRIFLMTVWSSSFSVAFSRCCLINQYSVDANRQSLYLGYVQPWYLSLCELISLTLIYYFWLSLSLTHAHYYVTACDDHNKYQYDVWPFTLINIYIFFLFFLEDHEARRCIHQRVEVPVRIKFCLCGFFNVSYKFLIVIIFKFILLCRVGLQQVITCQNWTKFFRYILFY